MESSRCVISLVHIEIKSKIPNGILLAFLNLFIMLFTHPRYTGMGFAIARILKISFANIGEVTDRIELNFGM